LIASARGAVHDAPAVAEIAAARLLPKTRALLDLSSLLSPGSYYLLADQFRDD
jgi:hypothetical protein